MSDEEYKVVKAGDVFRESMVPRADASDGFPLWHGWALMEAFIAGAKYGAAAATERAAKVAEEYPSTRAFNINRSATCENIAAAIREGAKP